MKACSVALLIIALVLSVASRAMATCAWVLWVRVMVPESRTPGMMTADPWSPTHSVSTLQECSDLLRQMGYRFDTGGGWVYRKDNRTWQAVCVPDTIDPRGPKGGSR